MKISATPFQLQFKHPFHLATGVRTHTDIVVVKLEAEGVTGFGEASLPPYLAENTASVMDFLMKLNPRRLDLKGPISQQLAYIDALAPGNTAAKAALDIALHDWTGKSKGISVSEMIGLPSGSKVNSTFTIGISDVSGLEEKLVQAAPFHMIKLKLGSPDDRALIEAFLERCDKPFCVDVNQGWKDKTFAADMADYLAEKGALFIEQPMPVSMHAETMRLRERSPLPLIADESVQRLTDLQKIAECFDGVNIKLMKSTGIAEAHRMVTEARRIGLKVVVGCMAESSCAVAAASHLAPLADWADLDGPLLMRNDPFDGLVFEDGQVVVPGGAGLGVRVGDGAGF